MKIAGIIAEYNPFHLGHAYQIEKARSLGATHVAVCMSGNFVQRGDCAVCGKYARTEAALKGGADLVIELSLPYAVSSAERFGFGGVSTLAALGCVDELVFGSESANAELIKKAVLCTETEKYSKLLKESLATGIVFPAARENAVCELCGEEASKVFASPNSTLGAEYIKWIERLNLDIKPVAIARKGAEHNSFMEQEGFASATAIREKALNGDDFSHLVPASAYEIYSCEKQKGGMPCTLKAIERAVLARLRTLNDEDYLRFADVTEGLEGRIASAVKTAESLDELYDFIKTKRYTMSRIRRIVLSAFLNLPASLAQQSPPYIHVLGFNKRGAEILARAKQSSSVSVSTSLADLQRLGGAAETFAKAEAKSGDVFALCSPKIMPCGLDYTQKPVIL